MNIIVFEYVNPESDISLCMSIAKTLPLSPQPEMQNLGVCDIYNTISNYMFQRFKAKYNIDLGTTKTMTLSLNNSALYLSKKKSHLQN
jgi:hypothetical protein